MTVFFLRKTHFHRKLTKSDLTSIIGKEIIIIIAKERIVFNLMLLEVS